MIRRIIGVAVEGIADKKFWDNVFKRQFRSGRVEFRVSQMFGRPNLIASSSEFLALNRRLGYHKTIFLVDRHRDPCVTALLNKFPSVVTQSNDVEIFVAIPGIEAWYLADGHAVGRVLPNIRYDPPRDTGDINPKRVLNELIAQSDPRGRARYKKTYFSTRIGRCFSPQRGSEHSASLARTWNRTKQFVEDP